MEEDKNESQSKARNCPEGHTVIQVCKACNYGCCEGCSQAHTKDTQHSDYIPIVDVHTMIKAELQERKQTLDKLKQRVNAEKQDLSAVRAESAARRYEAALKTLEELGKALDTQRASEHETMGSIQKAQKVLDECESKIAELEKAKEADLALVTAGTAVSLVGLWDKSKRLKLEDDERLKQVEVNIAEAVQVLQTEREKNKKAGRICQCLLHRAAQELRVDNEGEGRSTLLTQVRQLKRAFDTLREPVSERASSISQGLDELRKTVAQKIKGLHEQLFEAKHAAFQERFCSLCKKEGECSHRLECKHRICRECVTTTVVNQLTRTRRISLTCGKCGKESKTLIVEFACGCTEEAVSKRQDIINATKGDVITYNSVTLQISRPLCKSLHMLTDADLLLLFDRTLLQASMQTFEEDKAKDEMSSLRQYMNTVKEEAIVDLSGRLIGNEEARFVADFLKCNPRLKFLNLSTNELGDEGIVTLAEALRQHAAILKLDIRGNKFGEGGKNYLEDVNKEKGYQIRILYFYINMYLVMPQLKQH